MRIDILTIFPAMFAGPFAYGAVGRAVARGLLEVAPPDIRRFATDTHRSVDDYPYGGGPGMVLMPGPIFDAVESLHLPTGVPIILLSPQGRLFSQAVAHELAAEPRLILICGHYEGVDERVREALVDDEISIGDYVVSGGEIAAIGLVEYPQYTRPADFRGLKVPAILLSGHHAEVATWRRRQSLLRTALRRPDL